MNHQKILSLLHLLSECIVFSCAVFTSVIRFYSSHNAQISYSGLDWLKGGSVPHCSIAHQLQLENSVSHCCSSLYSQILCHSNHTTCDGAYYTSGPFKAATDRPRSFQRIWALIYISGSYRFSNSTIIPKKDIPPLGSDELLDGYCHSREVG